MATVVERDLHENIGVDNIEADTVPMDQDEEREMNAVHLGDSLSPGNRRKINVLLEGLYHPSSPESPDRGNNWEKICPRIENNENNEENAARSLVTTRSTSTNYIKTEKFSLDPNAAAFTPTVETSTIFEISDSQFHFLALGATFKQLQDSMNRIHESRQD